MAPVGGYSRAPIVEAVLDIQVELPSDFSLDELLKCQKEVKSEYPEKRPAQFVRGEVTVGQRVSTSASAEPVGYSFISHDQKQRFQAKTTGFTFNQLAPYAGWEGFFEEAKRLWEHYRKVAHPRGYKRVALRYINRFDFPSPTVQLEKYFRTHPEVSSDLPQLMANFFLRFDLPIEGISSTAAITQTIIEPKTEGQTSVVLDVDLFRTESLSPGNELWPLFEELRIWKNRIFEACITDDIREMIR